LSAIYTATVSADEVAQALATHFRAQAFEAQVFGTSENRTAMHVGAYDSMWRQALGVAHAVTVAIGRKAGQRFADLGEHEWVDSAVSAGIGLVAVPPVLLGAAYGI
jgi:hypothetical protein